MDSLNANLGRDTSTRTERGAESRKLEAQGRASIARNLEAHHVVYLGQGWKDHDVLRRVEERDYTLVTNNAVDFRRLYSRASIHAGLVIVVPNVVPALQRELMEAVLDHVGKRDLSNTVIEVAIEDGQIALVEYNLPDDQ